MHSLQEAVTVGDMTRSMPTICVTLENKQEEHHTFMSKIQGMINNQPISILIDPGASLHYISPRVKKNVNKEYKNKFLQILIEDTIHKAHKCSWCFGETKWYHYKLIIPIPFLKVVL